MRGRGTTNRDASELGGGPAWALRFVYNAAMKPDPASLAFWLRQLPEDPAGATRIALLAPLAAEAGASGEDDAEVVFLVERRNTDGDA